MLFQRKLSMQGKMNSLSRITASSITSILNDSEAGFNKEAPLIGRAFLAYNLLNLGKKQQIEQIMISKIPIFAGVKCFAK